MPASIATLSLKGRALRLLAVREYSRTEIERKLAPLEESAGDLARILDELAAKGLIDERRVVDSVVHRRAARLGTARIREELLGKGLGGEVTHEAVAALTASEFERAREVWRRKFGEAPRTPAERGRQARFLASRGFSAEVVRRLVSSPQNED